MLFRGYLIWGLLVLAGFSAVAGSGARLSHGGSSSSHSCGHGAVIVHTSGWSWGK